MSDEQKRSEEPTIRLGVSTCLLGERVRSLSEGTDAT
jgi:hypothetical protein